MQYVCGQGRQHQRCSVTTEGIDRSAIFYTSEEQKRVAPDTISDVEASGHDRAKS
jgi:peptide methionine sulfoxide reductase MsrA